MAYHALSDHFHFFFGCLNPSPSFEQTASREYNTAKTLIEDPAGLASILAPSCFLQGSYRQQTAIYTINDVDIVVLCQLWHPGTPGGTGWDRDQIFATIAAPLRSHWQYMDKVRYDATSMCIKVDLAIKLEILPVVLKAGTNDQGVEPFVLYRPESGRWEEGYARYHQGWLSWKNGIGKTAGNFIPLVKVLKHLRSRFGADAVSFHLECLLFSLPDPLFAGSPADYIATMLTFIATIPATTWYAQPIMTPCRERAIFSASEWTWERWQEFHALISQLALVAKQATEATDREQAIALWQLVLGEPFFPKVVAR